MRGGPGVFGLSGISPAEKAARILVATHRGGGNILICGVDAEQAKADLIRTSLSRVICLDPSAVNLLGQPGDTLIMTSRSSEPTGLLRLAAKTRDAGLRRIGFLPPGTDTSKGLLDVVLGAMGFREVARLANGLLRSEQTLVLALRDGRTDQGSEWAARVLSANGLKVVVIPAEEISSWTVSVTDLKRSAESSGVDLMRARVLSDQQPVLDAAALLGATPQYVAGPAGAADAAKSILMEHVSVDGSAPSGDDSGERTGSVKS